MIQRKILKILPYWLIALVVMVSAQTLAFSLESQSSTQTITAEQPVGEPKPEVLGEATSIRGQEALPATSSPIALVSEPDLSTISAKSYLVFDLSSGQNLLEKNIDKKLSIASLTKLITGFVTYQNIDLSQDITIAQSDTLNIKPNLDFKIGDSLKIGDAFNSMLIGSCNDAALSLANYVSRVTGKDFTDLMNQEAKNLGMKDSHFSNPMGFDSQKNYSSAEDLKILITATQQLAVFKNLGRRSSYQFTSNTGQLYSTTATNKLILQYPDIQAIKTGYTQGAGGAMASKISVAGHEVVIIVLDSKDRESDTLRLRSALKDSFKWN